MNTNEVKKSLKEIEDTLNDVYCDIRSIRAAADNIHLMLKIVNQQLGEIEPEKTYIDVILEQDGIVTLNEIINDYGFIGENSLVNVAEKIKMPLDDRYIKSCYYPKDRLNLYLYLKSHGILPLMERGDNA